MLLFNFSSWNKFFEQKEKDQEPSRAELKILQLSSVSSLLIMSSNLNTQTGLEVFQEKVVMTVKINRPKWFKVHICFLLYWQWKKW